MSNNTEINHTAVVSTALVTLNQQSAVIDGFSLTLPAVLSKKEQDIQVLFNKLAEIRNGDVQKLASYLSKFFLGSTAHYQQIASGKSAMTSEESKLDGPTEIYKLRTAINDFLVKVNDMTKYLDSSEVTSITKQSNIAKESLSAHVEAATSLLKELQFDLSADAKKSDSAIDNLQAERDSLWITQVAPIGIGFTKDDPARIELDEIQIGEAAPKSKEPGASVVFAVVTFTLSVLTFFGLGAADLQKYNQKTGEMNVHRRALYKESKKYLAVRTLNEALTYYLSAAKDINSQMPLLKKELSDYLADLKSLLDKAKTMADGDDWKVKRDSIKEHLNNILIMCNTFSELQKVNNIGFAARVGNLRVIKVTAAGS